MEIRVAILRVEERSETVPVGAHVFVVLPQKGVTHPCKRGVWGVLWSQSSVCVCVTLVCVRVGDTGLCVRVCDTGLCACV